MKISIQGSAVTQFGELWGKSLEDLLVEAMDAAIANSGLSDGDIEAIFVANKAGGNFNDQHHLNAIASSHFAHLPPAMRIEAACASGGLALLAAQDALHSGRYQTVLVVGVEKMMDVGADTTTHILSGAAHTIAEYGSTFPALYALITQAHQQHYHTSRELLSRVAVNNHQHAMTNPHAQFHKVFTIEQVSASALVADPLRLLDCSPISDGAAAVVLTTKKTSGKTVLSGRGHAQDTLTLHDRKELTRFKATTEAMRSALHEAGILHSEIQAVELHDCFTIAQILALEDLGFCPKGGVEDFMEHSGVTVNPSGGLKACGHPVGATGVKQVAYLAEYMQTHQLKHAVTHNVGGTGATAVVHVLSTVS